MSKDVIVTPKGITNYCWLSSADTKFNPDGVFHTNLILDPDTCKDLCKTLKKGYDDAQKPKKKAGKKPYFKNEDGDIEIKFSQKAIIRNKAGEEFKKTVAVLDSKQRPVKFNVGNGSTVKVSFKMRPYDYNGCGISLDLIAVQVLELVEYEGSQDFGFEDEEGGFESSGEVDNKGNLFTEESDGNDENFDSRSEDDEEDEPF